MSTDQKAKNPLFVVTNKGKDVEAVSNMVQAWLKKMGLDGVYDFILQLLQSLLAQINSYPMLVAVNQFIDEFNYKFQEFLARLGLGHFPARGSN